MSFTKYLAKNLSTGILISDNTSTLSFDSSGYSLPEDITDGIFKIKLEEEILTVNSVTDNTSSFTLGVTRAQESTFQEIHAADSTGYLVMTAGMFNNVSDYLTKIDVTGSVDLDDIETKLATIETGAEVNTVDSVNGFTGVVTLVTGNISDTTSTQKYTNSTDITKLSNISVTQPVDLDTMESNIATNNAKVTFDSTASTKVGYISVTQAVDLDTMESNIATNNAKVTNATHSGDVTGADVLGIVPAAISGRTGVTPVSGDYVLLWDATDSTLKKADIGDFPSGGGTGDVDGPASSVLNSLPYFDSTTGTSLESSNITIDGTGNNISIPGTVLITEQVRNSVQTTLTSTGAFTWNINEDPSAFLDPTGNITLTISGVNINSNATLYITQDATTAYTVDWDSDIIWAGNYAPDLSTLSSKHIINLFSFDGTGLFGTYVSNVASTSGLLHVSDSSNDHYFFGVDATGNKHPWSTGQSVIQLGEDLSIVNNKALSNTGSQIMLGAYIDSSGDFRYISTDDAQRINLNASNNQTDFYFCDSSSHVEGDGVNFKRRVAIAPAGLFLYNDSPAQVFSVDVTGNITLSGTVDGRDIAALGTKLDYITVTQAVDLDTIESDTTTNNAKVTNANHTGDVTGADVLGIVPAAISGKTGVTPVSGDYVLLWDATDSALKKADAVNFIPTVTTTNTVTLTNKTIVPRVVALTSGTTVGWNSDNGNIFRLNLGHNATILSDASGSPVDGQIAEFIIPQTAAYTLALDITGTKPFKYGSDVTGISADASGKTTHIITQYDSSGSRWNVLSQAKGY